MIATNLPEDRKPKSQQIFAAQKIIADISSGLYRSPAAAMKELVTNAYDADAEHVVIETDAPRFRNLVVRDDGSGMTIQHFIRVVTHIGGSQKRIMGGDLTPNKQRKIIGRIGIGMLAVAQLGFRFYVSSSVKGVPTRFLAEVDLEPFHKDDAALVSMGRINENEEVLIGAVRYVDDLPEDPDVHYTVITIPDVRKGLVSEVTSAVRKAVGAKETLSLKDRRADSFADIVEVSRGAKRADTELDGYYYMLWELGHLCPVNYLDDAPFRIEDRHIDGVGKVALPSIPEFKVHVDGIELRRPQLFPSKSAINYSSPDPKLYPLTFDRKIAGRRLRLSGYIYSQQPRIDPEELRGLHIRIRDVGIGRYDRTWLGYPFDEGIKFGQLSGEVFVEDGLEPALNIDRDSFKETDVHYQALRAYIWDKLRTEVFPEFKLRQKEYSASRKRHQSGVHENRFSEVLALAPAPVLIASPEVGSVTRPTVSSWIEAGPDTLKLDRSHWRRFTDETQTTATDAQQRFFRVLRVLISHEILTQMTDEEVEPLLKALAVAVQ